MASLEKPRTKSQRDAKQDNKVSKLPHQVDDYTGMDVRMGELCVCVCVCIIEGGKENRS